LGTGERIGRSRSRCFSCGTTLQWHDLIPLLSFALQKGRCRYCGSRISVQYPIVEFVTGMVFVLVAFNGMNYESGIMNYGGVYFSYLLLTTYYLLLFSILIAISVYDFRHKIIPNQLVYPFIILAFLFGNLEFGIWNLFGNWDLGFGASAPPSLLALHIFAGVVAFSFFASLWYFSAGRWMGFGDAKLALGIGFLLGPWLTLLAVVLSFWIGTLVAVPLVLWRGGGLKMQIPFGPFLAAGCFVAWMWGEQLLSFYLSVLS